MKAISLLGWKDAVTCQAIQLEADHIQLYLATKSAIVFCPFCGCPASRIHSHYSRKLADLPWAGKPVQIMLQVRRFFCDSKISGINDPIESYRQKMQRVQHLTIYCSSGQRV